MAGIGTLGLHLFGKPEKSDHLWNLRIDSRIILKLIWRMWAGFMRLRAGLSGITAREFLDHLLKKDFAPFVSLIFFRYNNFTSSIW